MARIADEQSDTAPRRDQLLDEGLADEAGTAKDQDRGRLCGTCRTDDRRFGNASR